MSDFKLYSIENAPADSQPLLEGAKKEMGMVPNLFGVMAESPQLLEAYQTMNGIFMNTSLSTEEKNVVWLSINVEHNCHYCVPAHTGIAKQMGVSDEVIEALRDEKPLPDDKLEALRTFTLTVVRERGHVSGGDVDAFLKAGFTKRNVMDVIVGVSQKVMSNYLNHIAETPVDDAFGDFAWEKK